MAVKSFKPYSAGRRFMTVSSFEEITAKKPDAIDTTYPSTHDK